jgi:hypothetical protein
MKMQNNLIYLLVAEAADMSLSDRCALLDGALLAQFGCDGSGYQRFWLQDTFMDYVIARGDDGKLFRITYTIDKDNNVTMGTADEVETAYVPVSESGTFVVAEAGATPDDGVFPIQVIKAGWGGGQVSGSNGLPHYYTPAFIGIVAEACNGARFGREHPEPKKDSPYQYGENDPKRIAGYLSGGSVVSEAAVSHVNLFKNETDLRGRLSSAREAGRLDLFGVSILATVGFQPAVREGKKCLEAVALGKLYSVDLCVEAGAGGRFIEPMRVAASANVSREIAAAQNAAVKQGSSVEPNRHSRGSQERATMNKAQILRVIEALRTKDPVKAAQLQAELNAAEETQLDAIFAKVTEAVAAPVMIDGKTPEQINAETKLLQFKNTMEAKLTDSKLPVPAQETVRRYFEGRVDCTAEQVDAEIKTVREAVASLHPVGRVNGISLVVGLDSSDKMQLAFDRMLGVKEAAGSGIVAFRGIREAYVTVTGDHDLSELHGSSSAFWKRASEAISTTDFPNLLLNSQTKRLLQDYAELSTDGLDSLYTAATIADFKLQDRVRDGYFGELPIVAESAPYLELAKPTDERVNYAVSNRGGLLTISEQTIRNDDLGAVAKFPARLARAGRQTLRTYISSFFVVNPNYMADGISWFNAGHNNLTSVPLTHDALIAVEVSLGLQTEKDSGEVLGLPLEWLMVPIQLQAAARAINQCDTAGSNSFFHRFGVNNERIIVNAKMTDANDWCFGTSSDNAPFLEIGFLDGIKQPQIFLANLPTQGTAFTNDEIQYKVKFAFGGAIIDYRGAGKSVVAG